MVRTTKYLLVQERLGGGRTVLEQILYWHTAGVSAPAIARLITRETGVDLCAETVRKWIRTAEAAA